MLANVDPRSVFLHIGLPKTGTTYLQELMAANRDVLAEAGLRYPLRHPEAMFHAAIDLRGTGESWGLTETQTRGAWDRLVSDVLDRPGPALVSHENFCAADPDQVAHVAASFPGRELHVVVTVRDLARQLTAGWQEGVKSGSAASFARFSGRIEEDLRHGTRHHRFWKMQDVPAVLDRWSSVAPPERTHVVVCPRPGADRRELWWRFADAVGVPRAVTLQDQQVRRNESLGVAAIALLRDLNEDLRDQVDRATYRHVVKRMLAQRVLPRDPAPRPASVPEALHADLRRLASEWSRYVESRGFPVHGDLAELLPSLEDAFASPDQVSDAEKYRAARLATAQLTLEVARLRQQPARSPARKRLASAWRAVRPGS